ncbi:MAG: FAD-dependent oxidoreductase, partial [Candidatus Dormibacteraceae bacterium]
MSGQRRVVVVGGGNAGFSAALAACEQGAGVVLLEKAAEEEAGGNSFYTAGAFRIAHGGAQDLAPLLAPEERGRLPVTDLPPYPAAAFRADLERVTEGRTDPAMADLLVGQSREVVDWLHAQGIRWRLMYERQAYERDGRQGFFGGLALGTVGGGKGLLERLGEAARRAGVEVRYGTPLTGFLGDGQGIEGVDVGSGSAAIEADA